LVGGGIMGSGTINYGRAVACAGAITCRAVGTKVEVGI